jgi:hypothetical protein
LTLPTREFRRPVLRILTEADPFEQFTDAFKVWDKGLVIA